MSEEPAEVVEQLHHESGPSTLKWQEICPSFENKEDDEDGQNRQTAADEGACLHMIMETGIVPDSFEYGDAERMLVDNTRRLHEELVDGAEEVLKETRYDIGKQPDGTHLTFGTCDWTALYPKLKLIRAGDYKFGFIPIDPPDINIQGQAYVLGIFEKFEWCDTVEFTFLAPRQTPEPLTHVYHRSDIPEIRARILAILERRKAGLVIPNPEACQYCSKLANCEEAWGRLLPVAKKYAQEADLYEEALKVNLGTVELMMKRDPQQVSYLMQMLDLMDKARKEVRDYVKDRMLHGVDVPDYAVSMRRKRQVRDFTRDRDAVVLAIEEFGVDAIDIMSAMGAVSRAAIERAISDKAERGQKKHKVQEFRNKAQEAGLWYDSSLVPEEHVYILSCTKNRRYSLLNLDVDKKKPNKEVKTRALKKVKSKTKKLEKRIEKTNTKTKKK